MVDLTMRDEPSTSANVVDHMRAGESVALMDGQPVVADGLTWYAVRQGPRPSAGWVTSGPLRASLSVVGNGRIAFYCTTCVPAPRGGGSGATFTIEPDGSDQRTVLDQAAVPTWSPDGTRLAVVALDPQPTRIVLLEPDGSGRVDIGSGTEPAWSTDGSRLAHIDEGGRLVILDGSGSSVVLAEGAASPAWSPDGARLAYTAIHCPGCATQVIDPPIALFIADVADGTIAHVIDIAHDPRWSPDGESIAIARVAYTDVITMEFAQVAVSGGDSAPVPGVPDRAAVDGFAWSPDGSRLVFGGEGGVFVANADGSDPRLVAANQGSLAARNPRWSPDGRFILYDVAATQGDAIAAWVVEWDGSAPHPLGDGVGYGADWQPLLGPLP